MTRETAKICSIQDLLAGELIVQEGWKPNYVLSHSRKLSRVNIMGIVVEKTTPFNFLFDDGTGTIAVIDFNNTKQSAQIKVGDPALVVGRPRKAKDQIFIAAEIVQSSQLKQQPLWLVYRKQELKKIQKNISLQLLEPKKIEDVVVKEDEKTEMSSPVPSQITGDDVVVFIKKKDGGDGCLIQDIIDYFGEEADDVVLTLLTMGEIYEIHPGRIKVLE